MNYADREAAAPAPAASHTSDLHEDQALHAADAHTGVGGGHPAALLAYVDDPAPAAAAPAAKKVDFNSIKEQARPYCPTTVQKYSDKDPSSIDRPAAQQMGNECLSEMNALTRALARPKIQAGIDEAFPKK